MKQIYTKSRRANRSSAFHQTPQYGFSAKRSAKRGNDQRPKTYGQQTYLQAIPEKAPRLYRQPRVKFIRHAMPRLYE